MMAFRYFLENGLVNLAVIVGFLIFSIGLIPMILWLGTARGPAASEPQSSQPDPGGHSPSAHS
jgi:hypothetical protein